MNPLGMGGPFWTGARALGSSASATDQRPALNAAHFDASP